MIWAFISDLHGNLPALEAAVADAQAHGAERILCAGDLVGYGPFPAQVCRFLKDRQITTVLGNYDDKVLNALNEPQKAKKSMKPGKWEILKWTVDQIGNDPEAREFLARLPRDHAEMLPGESLLLMVHGSPQSYDDTIYPSITQLGLENKLDERRPQILVAGHTHIPFVKQLGGTLVINCSSTGQPVDGDPRGAYALLKLSPEASAEAHIVRFAYDQERLLARLKHSDLPKHLRKDLKHGLKRRETP